MRAYFVGVLLTLSPGNNEILAQDHTVWYTWDPDSTSVYVQPEPGADVIRKVPYGTLLQNVERLNEAGLVTLRLGREFEGELPYQNYYVRVTDSTGTGYILRDQISKLPPLQRKHSGYESAGNYLKKIWPDNEEYQKSSEVPIRDNLYPKKVDSIAFQGKGYYSVKKFDSCVEYEHYSENWSFLEVFQVISTSLYIGNGRMILSLISINGMDDGVYDLGNGLDVQDVYMKPNESGGWIFGYYGCD